MSERGSRPTLTATTHVYTTDRQGGSPCETRIVSSLGPRGLRALDVGCGAKGRSARMLRSLGADVFPCDISVASLALFARGASDLRTRLSAADMARLPYREGAFDLVLVARCGLDYVATESRVAALLELERVLRPGGHLVFSSINTIGALLSPRGLLSPRYWSWRLRYLLSGAFARERLVDIQGLDMAHAVPRRVIGQESGHTALRLEYVTDRRALTRSTWLLTLLAGTPYFVFAKAQPPR